jgi:hypothetical protein
MVYNVTGTTMFDLLSLQTNVISGVYHPGSDSARLLVMDGIRQHSLDYYVSCIYTAFI